jgi:hypothetical protein
MPACGLVGAYTLVRLLKHAMQDDVDTEAAFLLIVWFAWMTAQTPKHPTPLGK